MTDIRGLLRQAIAARVAAQDALDGAKDALRRAESLAAECEMALSAHVDLDDRVREHRGLQVGAWALRGGGTPPSGALPPALAAEAAQRDARLAALETARAGVSHLTASVASGMTDLRRCEHDVVRCAEDVVLSHCGDIEARWSAAFAEAGRLAVELRASAATWFAAPSVSPRPLTISAQHRSAIKVINEAAVSGLNGSMMNAGMHPFSTKVGDWWRRLCEDADAELDEPTAEVVPMPKPKRVA